MRNAFKTASAISVVTAALIAASGCGGARQASRPAKPDLVVSAASSLKQAFDAFAARYDNAVVRSSFANSDELAAQIERGARPDVYAAANTRLPRELHAKGLLERPVVFATNRVVIAVPTGTTKIGSFADLAKPGVRIAAGSSSVPIGEYTRRSLSLADDGARRAILANIRSNEPDAVGVVGKVAGGAVDAGFVYATDVRGAGGRLSAIELPRELQTKVEYAIGVVSGCEHPKQARSFISGLLGDEGRRALRAAGFAEPGDTRRAP